MVASKIYVILSLFCLILSNVTLSCELTSFCLTDSYDKEILPSIEKVLNLRTKIEILDIRVRSTFFYSSFQI